MANPPAKKKTICKLSHEDAFQKYYAMGDDRSINKLHQFCTKTAPEMKIPAVRTLKDWSKKQNWQARINEMESRVSSETSALVIKQDSQFQAKQVAVLQEIADLSFGLALQQVKAEANKKPADQSKDFKYFMEVGVKAMDASQDLLSSVEKAAQVEEAKTAEDFIEDDSNMMAELNSALREKNRDLLLKRTTTVEEVHVLETDTRSPEVSGERPGVVEDPIT